MGRPIKSIYFGNRNTDEVGGEALYSTGGNVALTFTGNLGFGYYSANAAATFSAPTVTGGVTAVAGTVYLHANGAIKAVGISNTGTGYTAASTLTFTGANVAAPATVTALFAATHPYFTESVPCDSDTDQDDDSASDYNSSLSLLFMGSVQGLFSFFSFFSLYASSGFLCGGHVPLYLSSLPGRR
jgi:hypothetical protein